MNVQVPFIIHSLCSRSKGRVVVPASISLCPKIRTGYEYHPSIRQDLLAPLTGQILQNRLAWVLVCVCVRVCVCV